MNPISKGLPRQTRVIFHQLKSSQRRLPARSLRLSKMEDPARTKEETVSGDSSKLPSQRKLHQVATFRSADQRGSDDWDPFKQSTTFLFRAIGRYPKIEALTGVSMLKYLIESTTLVISRPVKGYELTERQKEVSQLFLLTGGHDSLHSGPLVHEVTKMQKKERPDHVAEYLSLTTYAKHMAKFRKYVVYIAPAAKLDKYGLCTPDGYMFVMSLEDAIALIERTGDDTAKLEKELGIPPGGWAAYGRGKNGELINIVLIKNPEKFHIDMPNGKCYLANPLWEAGGLTPLRIPECVIYFEGHLPTEDYEVLTTSTFLVKAKEINKTDDPK